MAQAIYKFWTAKPTEAWHQLSQEEQNKLFAKNDEIFAQVGGKRLVFCNSVWASEEWPAWGVEQFADIEAEQKHADLLYALNWHRYFRVKDDIRN